jgi:uncharacterized membrane protein YccC
VPQQAARLGETLAPAWLIEAGGSTASVTGLQLLVYTTFSTGPLGALRPWWHTPLLFLAGVAWSVLLWLPGWLVSPHAAVRRVQASFA